MSIWLFLVSTSFLTKFLFPEIIALNTKTLYFYEITLYYTVADTLSQKLTDTKLPRFLFLIYKDDLPGTPLRQACPSRSIANRPRCNTEVYTINNQCEFGKREVL